MTSLTAEDFPTFFLAVHGYEPFAWQASLAHRVLEGDGWPEGIDVPTGMGKTAVVDVAVFAIAAQAKMDEGRRRAPTRTFVVVDRRIIVDQTYRRAEALRIALDSADSDSLVGRVAAALRLLSKGPPLQVVRMRGGATWAAQWLARPTQPAVVVGTVDQFGSRLLFRGYGVSEFRRPIDAALCGADSLLLMDEAHLSQPLVETVRSASAQEGRAERPVLGRRDAGPVLLSATLPPGLIVHRLDMEAETSVVARRRLGVSRRLQLVDLTTRKDPTADLAHALARLAVLGSQRAGVTRVAVVCNTVRLARETFALIAEAKPDADLALLIGRCRQAERDVIARTCLAELEAGSDRPDRPIIAVATQTIEVGADLDFDWVVSEAAPLDALLQRLGRLNRRGTSEADTGAVVVHTSARHDDDVVYGMATARTWTWLVEEAGTPTPTRPGSVADTLDRSPEIDLGPRALNDLLSPDSRGRMAADTALAPVALGPMFDAWARTSPAPVPDQPVAPYLHGVTRPTAEIHLCWRAGLPSPLEDLDAWEQELATAPCSAFETVAVPIWEAQRFLNGDEDTGLLSDLEGAGDIELDDQARLPAVIVSPDGVVVSAGNRALRPGDTVVVSSSAGGHDKWGWTGVAGDAVPDVADLGPRPRTRLRLRLEALGVPASGDQVQELQGRLKGLVSAIGGDPEEAHDIQGFLSQALEHTGGPFSEEIRAVAAGLSGGTCSLNAVHKWAVVTGPNRARGSTAELFAPYDDAVDDGDVVTTSGSRTPVSLSKHLVDVGGLARRFAIGLGLTPGLVEAVDLAGRCHDLGKADDRFQAMLHRGDVLEAMAAREPLAKSGMDPADKNAFRRARRLAHWPRGMCHEAISGALVAELVRHEPAMFDGIDADLVCHLVQSHHGSARPLLPPALDDDARVVSAAVPGTAASPSAPSDSTLVDWDGPARFARLGRRYGWWGLALLESIVRMADMEVSASYERESTSA